MLNPVPHPLRNVTWIPKPWCICAAAATFVGARTLPQPPHTPARSSAPRCSYLRSSCHARSHHLRAHNAASNYSANSVTVPCHVVPCRASRRRAGAAGAQAGAACAQGAQTGHDLGCVARCVTGGVTDVLRPENAPLLSVALRLTLCILRPVGRD